MSPAITTAASDMAQSSKKGTYNIICRPKFARKHKIITIAKLTFRIINMLRTNKFSHSKKAIAIKINAA